MSPKRRRRAIFVENTVQKNTSSVEATRWNENAAPTELGVSEIRNYKYAASDEAGDHGLVIQGVIKTGWGLRPPHRPRPRIFDNPEVRLRRRVRERNYSSPTFNHIPSLRMASIPREIEPPSLLWTDRKKL